MCVSIYRLKEDISSSSYPQDIYNLEKELSLYVYITVTRTIKPIENYQNLFAKHDIPLMNKA